MTLLRLTWLLPLLLTLSACSDTNGNTNSGKKRPPKAHLVETVEVLRNPVSSAHVRTGSLRVRRVVRLHNQEQGRINALPYYEGDAVAQGEMLVRLDDALLQAELAKARANVRQASMDLKRVEGLTRKRAASEDERLKAQTALEVAKAEQQVLQTRLAFTRIEAPFDGLISKRMMEPGDLAASNSHLLTLIDPDSLVIDIYLSELLMPHLKTGDPVRVRIDALGQTMHPGTILRIHPELDPITRQGQVEVALQPIPAGARAGQFARVTLETAKSERILLPFASVRRDRQGEYVYRLSPESRALKVRVTTGIRVHNQIEILSGLEPGEQIISRGFLGLAEDKQVKPVNGPG